MGSAKFVDELGDSLGAIRLETIKLYERRIPSLNFLLESFDRVTNDSHLPTLDETGYISYITSNFERQKFSW